MYVGIQVPNPNQMKLGYGILLAFGNTIYNLTVGGRNCFSAATKSTHCTSSRRRVLATSVNHWAE